MTTPKSHLRLRGLAVGVPCWCIVAAACLLAPRADGYGTHEQLGLPSCSFLATRRLPCPTCGLTTSVSAMAQGKFAAALRAHPFGIVLLPALLALGAAGTVELLSGRAALNALRPGLWWFWGALAGLLAGWGANVAVGLASGSLPLR